MNPLLDIHGLTLHYAGEGRTIHAVDDVSLTLSQAGEAIGIVGESGSGKTSLATALMRLLPKNVRRFEGQMLLDGRDISALPEETFRREVRWREIAMVFQGAMNVLNPVLRIGEQIAEPLFVNEGVPRDAALKRAGETLERVGLPTTMLH
ncbi:MAG: ATP-binding cassette domain-containing protein, partial [Chloroflexota bacterium]|nr:ATP-binding cassette domain-containing protein [Chloroflexota bacterium]